MAFTSFVKCRLCGGVLKARYFSTVWRCIPRVRAICTFLIPFFERAWIASKSCRVFSLVCSGPLRQAPPRDGLVRQAQGARSGPKGDLRRARPKPSPHHRRFGRREMAPEGQREGGRAPRRAHRECLSCLAFPESRRGRIRTTNGLERLDQEIKQRTRVVRIFPNQRSCLRLVTALAVEQSEEWRG